MTASLGSSSARLCVRAGPHAYSGGKLLPWTW